MHSSLIFSSLLLSDCEIASSSSSGHPSPPNRHSTACHLPRWGIHVVHALCIVLIICPDVVTLVLAHSFNMNLALRWLTVSICGLVLSIFVYEVLKVRTEISMVSHFKVLAVNARVYILFTQ